jgi:putative tryptophan/tyrosine transport system substrate-binding protein
MRRREFITLLGSAAASLVSDAHAQQQRGRVWHVGVLGVVPPTADMLSIFRDALRERGYVEGQNLSIDVRWPQGSSFERNPGVATELVRSNVDAIVTWATEATMAASRATLTIPIVMVGPGDPLGMHFIASLAHPGGNITGVTNISLDLAGKLIERFVEIVPGMKSVGVVANLRNPVTTNVLQQTEVAIRNLGLRAEVVEAGVGEELEIAFAALSTKHVEGIVLIPEPFIIEHRVWIAELALKAGLPTAFQRRENVEAGGLLSYGPNLKDQWRQAAVYVDRILKGALPAEMPVEQPTKFDLVINLKTARALGLDVPLHLQQLADEVIE